MTEFTLGDKRNGNTEFVNSGSHRNEGSAAFVLAGTADRLKADGYISIIFPRF